MEAWKQAKTHKARRYLRGRCGRDLEFWAELIGLAEQWQQFIVAAFIMRWGRTCTSRQCRRADASQPHTKDVTTYIEEYALGRKLTRAELRRFVEKNVLTINRQPQ